MSGHAHEHRGEVPRAWRNHLDADGNDRLSRNESSESLQPKRIHMHPIVDSLDCIITG